MTEEPNPLAKAAVAAYHALRTYQYGNSSPELAEEVADALLKALREAGCGDDMIRPLLFRSGCRIFQTS